jgi:hypothetical protein
MIQHEVQCFWAEQETHYDMEKTVSVKTESDTVKVAVITTENRIVINDKDNDHKDETLGQTAPIDTTDLETGDDINLAQVSPEV